MPPKKPIIAANWKMHKSCREVEEFFNTLALHIKDLRAQIWVAPSATALQAAARKIEGTSVLIGAQNIYFEPQGPFTGEVSAMQVRDAGASFVIIGHSERRHLFGETNAEIEKKIGQALQHQLVPLLCVGETSEERKKGKTKSVLKEQLTQALQKHPDFDGVIAYEPVWAIGTGQSATSEMIEEAHAACKEILKAISAKGSQILYGGSVTPETAASLGKTKNVDGILVGGASLEALSFISIIKRYLQ